MFTLTARTSDDARTREALARLQGPVAGQLAGGSPFTQRTARGADAFTLPVTDALEPSYAVSKDALVASTARSGLDQLAKPKAAVTAAPALAARHARGGRQSRGARLPRPTRAPRAG